MARSRQRRVQNLSARSRGASFFVRSVLGGASILGASVAVAAFARRAFRAHDERPVEPRMMAAHKTKVRATMSMIPLRPRLSCARTCPPAAGCRARQAARCTSDGSRSPGSRPHTLPSRPRLGALEQEDVLHRDHLAFHAGDLGDRRSPCACRPTAASPG